MVERWEDDITFERALYHLYVMKQVMEGIKDAEEGRVLDFDEVFDELQQEVHPATVRAERAALVNSMKQRR